MASLIQNLTSISPELRSGPSPGRRLLAVVLCAMLVLGATFPGIAVAGEADSEGEGTGAPIEVPLAPPDFEPGGEETDLEETLAGGEEEGVAVEAETEAEAPTPESVTGVTAEAPVEPPPPVPTSPEAPVYTPQPEPAQQEEALTPEPAPVEGQAIVAPKQHRVEGGSASESAASAEVPPPAEPAQQEAPQPPPRSVVSTPADPGRDLAGKDTYVVRPGDCLWQIAADLLGPRADTQAIEDEVDRLWRLNEDRIGTGNPSLIYAGTELRLR